MTQSINKILMNCPIAKSNYDTITLAHGSGGVLTNRLLNENVFNLLSNEYLDQKHDGAIFSLSGELAFSTDSYVVNPIFFPGGDIGELAVNGTVNDLSMCGAVPLFLSLSFIIEEGLPVSDLKCILQSIKKAADNADVKIVTGDTKVVEKGKGDKIFINTSGIGKVSPKADIKIQNVKPTDHIIISNDIASHGITILGCRESLDFESNIKSDTQNLNYIVQELIDEFGKDIHILKDPTRGGLASVLNEIAKDAKVGIEISQKDIPIMEEVEGACELLGIDPLFVANEGVFIAFVAEGIATKVVDKLRINNKTKNASDIGIVSSEHIGKVIIDSVIGGKRVLNMPVGEQLPRIC